MRLRARRFRTRERCCPRARRGFTLIEAVIALSVLAVLGAVALPSLGARADRARLHGTAQLLAADVAQARFESARRGMPLYLKGSPGIDGSGWCWVVATNPDCGCGQAQACEISHVSAADHPGVRLADALDLRFDPEGGTIAPASVRLASKRGERLRVEVSPLGRARVCSESGAGAGVPAC